MTKYRIISDTRIDGKSNREKKFIIQREHGIIFKKWENILITENGMDYSLTFHSFTEAENYLFNKYLKCNGNVITIGQSIYLYYIDECYF